MKNNFFNQNDIKSLKQMKEKFKPDTCIPQNIDDCIDKLQNLIFEFYNKPSIMPATPILYTVKEVATILKTNVDYVHSLRKAGLLPFIKLGQYKVRHESLMKFLQDFEGEDLTNPFEIKELKHE